MNAKNFQQWSKVCVKKIYFLQYSNRAKVLLVISCNIYWAMVQLVQKHNGYECSSGERCIMDGKFLIFLQVRYRWGEKYWWGGGHWSFRVRWDPVTWLLIDGLFCLIRTASMIGDGKGHCNIYIYIFISRLIINKCKIFLKSHFNLSTFIIHGLVLVNNSGSAQLF